MAKVKINIYGQKSHRDKEGEALARKAVRAAVGRYLPTVPTQVDIRMVGREEIQQINLETREVDKVTDVLSFPMLEMGDGVFLGDMSREIDPESGLVFLGDMMICYDKVVEQGLEYGHGSVRECAYLAVHSALHLLGFDHEDESEKKALMRKAEEAILEEM